MGETKPLPRQSWEFEGIFSIFFSPAAAEVIITSVARAMLKNDGFSVKGEVVTCMSARKIESLCGGPYDGAVMRGIAGRPDHFTSYRVIEKIVAEDGSVLWQK
jgi:hypothetical protein